MNAYDVVAALDTNPPRQEDAAPLNHEDVLLVEILARKLAQ